MSDISINNISFSYDVRRVLERVRLNIPEGEFFGVIGPNGSGKTTLLRCISGYLKPEEGGVLIGGKDVGALSTREIAKRMALVQQSSSLEYDFTVMDIVLTGRNPHINRMRGETEEDYAVANEALAKAGISGLKERLVTTLSGGEWQRMILARALAQQADIMLLDEPVSGLDIKHQVNIMSAVKRLAAERNITAVCVLHDLNLAYAYCDEVALLKDGKVFAAGAPREVMTKDNLESVYETDINIIEQDGETYILPVMG